VTPTRTGYALARWQRPSPVRFSWAQCHASSCTSRLGRLPGSVGRRFGARSTAESVVVAALLTLVQANRARRVPLATWDHVRVYPQRDHGLAWPSRWRTCQSMTGALQAYAAYALLHQPPRRTGFASACQAFGHSVLRSFGPVAPPVLTRES
jgi:Family of unknown function (DUF5938)